MASGVTLRGARLRHRHGVPQRSRPRLLHGCGGGVHALPAAAQERPGTCRAEERCSGTADRHYRRLEDPEAAVAQAELYRSVRTRYHTPAMLCQQLLSDPQVTEAVTERLHTIASGLDSVRLLRDMRAAQQRLVEIADRTGIGAHAAPTQPTVEQFLTGVVRG